MFMENENSIIEKVAHDLGGIINKINLINSMLMEAEAGDQETKQLLLSIKQLCDQGNNITKNLLTSCEDDTAFILPYKCVCLNTLLSQRSEIYRLEADKKKINFEMVIPKEPLISLVEPYKLMRVLDNLFSNALKFTSQGGKISVILSGSPERTIIAVKDNGIGIPERLKKDLFKKYTSARRNGTANEICSGLGLYISKRIIESFKGSVSFRSAENKGSAFFIELIRKAE